jgi:hypothetical protein
MRTIVSTNKNDGRNTRMVGREGMFIVAVFREGGGIT